MQGPSPNEGHLQFLLTLDFSNSFLKVEFPPPPFERGRWIILEHMVSWDYQTFTETSDPRRTVG